MEAQPLTPELASFDTITGTNGPDSLVGTAANDEIYGLAGDDIIRGLEGNDRLYPGDGVDNVDGGLGNDQIIYSDSAQGWTIDLFAETASNGFITEVIASIEDVTGSQQDDIIRGSGESNFINGGRGNDRLEGRGGNDDLRAGLGDDLVIGGDGNDRLDGGDGSDTVSYEDQPGFIIVDLTAEAAFNGLFAERVFRFENAIGTVGNDSLFGNEGDNVLDGGADGADYMFGAGGSDTASWASNVRSVIIDLEVGAAFDGVHLDTFIDIERVIGSRFNDTVFGAVNRSNHVDGGPGGADIFYGGALRDTLTYGSSVVGVIVDLTVGQSFDGTSADTFFNFEIYEGSNFNDQMFGTVNGDEIFGLAGDDYIFGWAGPDQLFGGAGNDLFIPDEGADFIDGGPGIDTLSYVTAITGVNVNMLTGTAFDGAATDTFIEMENLVGSAFNDQLRGNNGDNVIDGGTAGADILDGLLGFDTVTYANAIRGITLDVLAQFADDGVERDIVRNFESYILTRFNDQFIGGNLADLVDGGAGADDLDGGAGIDTVSFASSATGVIVDLPSNAAFDGTSVDRIVNFENVIGSAFNDQIFGNALGNLLRGGAGDDLLQGESGNDVLDGGPGADRYQGGSGNDDYVLRKGEADGDWIQTFVGNGAAAGDRVILAGWSPLSTMVLIDPVQRLWRITDGADSSTAVVRIEGDFDPQFDLTFG